ncbi:TldD/PmbA family protein, partial [Candidatus Parvarchaeota archaeon]|nr:TldD/PmbA family protein [Candidatus Parvarchaeota archaeon]
MDIDLASIADSIKPDGAKSLELYFEKCESTSFSCLDNTISSSESDFSQGFGIRVCDKDGRLGFAFCDSQGQLEKTASRAFSLCRHSTAAPGFVFPCRQKYAPIPALLSKQMHRIAALPESDAKSLFSALIEASRKGGCSALEGSFSLESSEISIANTAGLYAAAQEASIAASIQSKYQDSSYFAAIASQSLSSLEANLSEQGELAASHAKASCGAKKTPSGKYDVLFELTAISSLIGDILMPSFDSKNIRRDVSRLSGKLGQRIFSQSLTLADDPLEQNATYSKFDGEGVASMPKTLVEKGVVKNFLFDSRSYSLFCKQQSQHAGETGNRGLAANEAALGNCSRGSYQSLPGIGESNLVIRPGRAKSLEQLAGSSYIQLHSFHGTHTANTTTGDFSVVIDLAYLCQKGQGGSIKKTPIRGNILTGNVFSLLGGEMTVEA